jgi:hypothetical protein
MRNIVMSAAVAAVAAAAAPAAAEIYPRQFHNDYVRVCAASEGLQQYGLALAFEICHCAVKFLEFRLTYQEMTEEFRKSERGQANRFDAVISEGGRFCEKLMSEPR